MKEITLNASVFLHFLKTLILINKEAFALSLIKTYDKYFDDLVLANIKFLEQVAIVRQANFDISKIKFEQCVDMIK